MLQGMQGALVPSLTSPSLHTFLHTPSLQHLPLLPCGTMCQPETTDNPLLSSVPSPLDAPLLSSLTYNSPPDICMDPPSLARISVEVSRLHGGVDPTLDASMAALGAFMDTVPTASSPWSGLFGLPACTPADHSPPRALSGATLLLKRLTGVRTPSKDVAAGKLSKSS